MAALKLDLVHAPQDEETANDNQAAEPEAVRPMGPRYLTEAGDEARMRAARALAQVMAERGWSGRQLARWFRVDERRVREMLAGDKPIACERLVSQEVPATACDAILDAMKAARRAA